MNFGPEFLKRITCIMPTDENHSEYDDFAIETVNQRLSIVDGVFSSNYALEQLQNQASVYKEDGSINPVKTDANMYFILGSIVTSIRFIPEDLQKSYWLCLEELLHLPVMHKPFSLQYFKEEYRL